MSDSVSLLLGLSGVVVLVAGPGLSPQAGKLPVIALALTAAVLFAVGTVTAKLALPVDPLASTAWHVALGCGSMVAFGWTFEQPDILALRPANVGALAYIALMPMAICYVAWFGALQRLRTSTATMGTLLVPVIGTCAAAWWLQEPLSARIYISIGLILGGVAIAVQRRSN